MYCKLHCYLQICHKMKVCLKLNPKKSIKENLTEDIRKLHFETLLLFWRQLEIWASFKHLLKTNQQDDGWKSPESNDKPFHKKM